MTDPADLVARRWANGGPPSAFKPIDAMRACLRDMEDGTVNPAHIVVIVASEKEDGGTTLVYQAGTHGYHARKGLVARGAEIVD